MTDTSELQKLLGAAVSKGLPAFVAVTAQDRAEFARGLLTQGHSADRAIELATTIGDNDAALQMMARHRLASIAGLTKAAGWASALHYGCEQDMTGNISSHSDFCVAQHAAAGIPMEDKCYV